VTNQMKLLPTAFFSVVALNRSLQLQQWISLPVLALGVSVVNLSASAHAGRGTSRAVLAHDAASTTDGVPVRSHTSADGQAESMQSTIAAVSGAFHGHWFLGLAAALAAAVFSGYASVFVERLLKTERFGGGGSGGMHHLVSPVGAGSSPGAKAAARNSDVDTRPLVVDVSGDDDGVAEEGGRQPTSSVENSKAHGIGEHSPRSGAITSGGNGVPSSSSQGGGGASLEVGRPLLTLNVQLAGWGALFAGVQVLGYLSSAPDVRGRGLAAVLDNFNTYTWAVIWLQALGGLVVGLVLKYTDNIVKGFATAVSILLSCVLESAMNRVLPSPSFLIGLALVLLSFALFSGPEDLLTRTLGPHLTATVGGSISACVTALARGWRGGVLSAERGPGVGVFVLTVIGVGVGGLIVMTYMQGAQQGGVGGAALHSPAAENVAAMVSGATVDGEVLGVTRVHNFAAPGSVNAYPPPVTLAAAVWSPPAQADDDRTVSTLVTTSEAGLGAASGQVVVALQRQSSNASSARVDDTSAADVLEWHSAPLVSNLTALTAGVNESASNATRGGFDAANMTASAASDHDGWASEVEPPVVRASGGAGAVGVEADRVLSVGLQQRSRAGNVSRSTPAGFVTEEDGML